MSALKIHERDCCQLGEEHLTAQRILMDLVNPINCIEESVVN